MKKLNTPAEDGDCSEMLRRLREARATWHGRRTSGRPLNDARIRRVHAVLPGRAERRLDPRQAGACAGLASPLLHPLGLDSFTVDISGRSTRGKTITAMVALSRWADPSDRAEAMLTWQAASVCSLWPSRKPCVCDCPGEES